ncbi:hypothetical protein K439DRAFT_1339680 [Ramaria rubella]|nr:hypothetical protein K439DRAFT_1339680 [Ramaria rubella]
MASGYASPPQPISPPAVLTHPGQPEYTSPPHPYLREPLLYLTNLAANVTDSDLARAFESCVPFRPNVSRDGSGRPLNGTIEFKELAKAEKALTTLHGRAIPYVTPPAHIYLSPFPPTNPPYVPPVPQAQPRLVKHLPPQFTDSALYDLFRPYGPMASVRAEQAGFGDGTGVVEFYLEDDARVAEAALHCAEVGESNIAVQVYQQRRASGNASEFGVNPNATSFVPGGSSALSFQGQQQYSPPRPQYGFANLRQTPPFVHGPGQQVQFAPMHGPGSTSHSGLIDPCNLFCKNLDPDIDSNGLFAQFRRFGQIVSARVMRNDNGQSRGFGFVSFQTPDQAASAMQAMNGIIVGSKQLVVRLHEPKQLRQEKLAHRFGSGSSSHPRRRSGSGATSPTLSEGGESYWGRSSPGGPVSPGGPIERVRRSSGSYYTAALAGNLNLPMRYDELSALSPVVRREVLTGELSRRVKDIPEVTVADNEVDSVVDALLGLSLHQVVDGIQDSAKLAEQVRNAKDLLSSTTGEAQPSTHSPSPAGSHDSRLLDPNALNATASAPEHPSTPLSLSASLSTPPRTSSPSGSVAPGASERERLMAAVTRLEPKNAAEITELLMSLSKRERALCLFNIEVLKTKVAEASEVLQVITVDDDPSAVESNVKGPPPPAAPSVPAVPVTPHSKSNPSTSDDSPQTPELSSGGPSAAASPGSPPPTPSQGNVHTLASLARLPAAEIVRLASSSSATGLPLAKADPLVTEETNKFIDGLQGKPTQQQKQLLGEKLFRVVKTFGVKSAPKITIALLDQEDIRSLAHLMNSYPSVLREKALQSPLATGK